jgi:hypothetical protein
MKELNLQIFSENEDFYIDVDRFMCEKSKEYEKIKKRILSLNHILDVDQGRDLKIDYFLGGGLDGKFTFDNLFGESYNSREIDVISLSGVTHVIRSIDIDHINFEYSAQIELLNTPDGTTLMSYPENFLILKPVYLQKSQQILTFNIDINRSEVYRKILSRPAA